MKIRKKYSNLDCEVYAIYWAEFRGNKERYHIIIPEDNWPGFITVPESECELIDNSVNNFVLIKDYDDSDMFFHPILADDRELYGNVVEHFPEAMEKFLSLLNRE